MQEITKKMCRFLSENEISGRSDTELYNSFLMQNSLNGAQDLTFATDHNTGEKFWCRYEEFIRLRKLPQDVLSIMGGSE